MPLNTEIIGIKGETVQVPWDYTHLSIMLTVALREDDPDFYAETSYGKKISDLPEDKWIDFAFQPIYYLNTEAALWTKGEHVVQNNYEFLINEDGTKFILRKGYKLRMWRSHK